MLLRKAIFYIDFIILALYLLQLSYIFFKQKLNLDKIALIALFSYLVAFLFKALETLVDVSNALDDTFYINYLADFMIDSILTFFIYEIAIVKAFFEAHYI